MDLIFIKDDIPAKFFIHRNVTDGQRRILEDKIVVCGASHYVETTSIDSLTGSRRQGYI